MQQDDNPITLVKSAHPRAMWACYLLGIEIIVLFISTGSNLLHIGLLSRIAAGSSISNSDVSYDDARQAVIALAKGLSFGAATFLFLMWIHRANRVLPSLGVSGLGYTPRWAVVSFFVPFLNLYQPFQVVREIWKASGPSSQGDLSWASLKTSPLIGGWWAISLISFFVGSSASLYMLSNPAATEGLLSLRVYSGTGEASFLTSSIPRLFSITQLDIISDITAIFWALLTIMLINDIDRRQQSRFKILSAVNPTP